MPESNSNRSPCATLSCLFAIVLQLLCSTIALRPPIIEQFNTSHLVKSLDYPLYIPGCGCLVFTDITTGSIYTLDRKSDSNDISEIKTTFSQLTFIVRIMDVDGGARNRYVAGTGSSLTVFENTTTVNVLKTIPFEVIQNELLISAVTDHLGRLLVASDLGSVYRVVEGGAFNQVLRDAGKVRALAFNPLYNTFYLADSSKSVIVQYGYDLDKGEFSLETKVVIDFKTSNFTCVPVGLAVNKESTNAWVACSGTDYIVNVDLNKGIVVTNITLEGAGYVTSLVYGMPNSDCLLVTTDHAVFLVADYIYLNGFQYVDYNYGV